MSRPRRATRAEIEAAQHAAEEQERIDGKRLAEVEQAVPQSIRDKIQAVKNRLHYRPLWMERFVLARSGIYELVAVEYSVGDKDYWPYGNNKI